MSALRCTGMPVPQEPLSVEETTVAPSVRTAIEPLDVGNGIGVNRALAEALAVTHRVEHTLQRARETPPPDPMSASAEEKLLRAIVGDKVAQELPPHLDDSGVARRGERVSRGMLLVKDAGGGDVWFTGAAHGEVDRVDRITAGLPKGIAEVVTVVVVWRGALTPGDLLADAAGPIGAVESIVDDGSAAPRLYLGARERERFARTSSAEVTRVLPTAMQRMEARGIGPYSIVSDYPITGERLRAGQLEWLAARGCLALFSDFAWYKGGVVTARTRVYEDLVTRRPIPDPWTELRDAHEYAKEKSKPAAESAPASGLRDIFSFFEKPSPDRMIGRSFHTVRALLRVAGVDLALEGHAIRARPAFSADPGDASRGAVVRPETLNYRTRLPEPGGLFCQKIFGPIRDYECACGKYRRMRHRGIVCETCGVEVIASRVRTERFGHVPLPSPVVPIHLRPLLAALLDEDAEAAIATIDADGGEALAARLSGLDPAAIATRYSAGDARREWVEALARSGVAPEAVLWKHVLVLPPDLRPLIALSGGRWATSDLNDLYRRLINRANRLRRLIELNAPDTILANERRMLRQAVDQLLVNTGRGAARFGDRTLSSMIPQALGALQADAARRVDYSGRAVALVAEGAGGRPAKVPQPMLFELFRPILYGLCEEKGYTTSIKSAKALVEKDAALQRALLAEAIRDRPLLFGAAETGDVLAAGPVEIGEDPVVRLPPEIAARIGVAQGESVVLHVPLCDRAVEEARWLAAAGTTGVLHPVDVAHPSWLASLPDAPREAAEQLILGALRGESDPALRPSLAFLIGGYELPEQPTS